MTEYEKSRDCPKNVAILIVEIIGDAMWSLDALSGNTNRDLSIPAIAIEVAHIRYLPNLVLGFSWKRLDDYLTYDRVHYLAERQELISNSSMPGLEKIWSRLEALLHEFKEGQTPVDAADTSAASDTSENFTIIVSRGQTIDYGDWIRYVERSNVTLEVAQPDPTVEEVLAVIKDHYLKHDIAWKDVLDLAYLVAMNPDRMLLELSRKMSEYDIRSGSQFNIGSFIR